MSSELDELFSAMPLDGPVLEAPPPKQAEDDSPRPPPSGRLWERGERVIWRNKYWRVLRHGNFGYVSLEPDPPPGLNGNATSFAICDELEEAF